MPYTDDYSSCSSVWFGVVLSSGKDIKIIMQPIRLFTVVEGFSKSCLSVANPSRETQLINPIAVSSHNNAICLFVDLILSFPK